MNKSNQLYSLSQKKLKRPCVLFFIDIHYIPIPSYSSCQLSPQVRRPAERRSNQLARWPIEKPPETVSGSPCQRLSWDQQRCPILVWVCRCINIWRVMWTIRKAFCHIPNRLGACPWAVPSGRLCTCMCQRDKVFWPAYVSRSGGLGVVGSCPSV